MTDATEATGRLERVLGKVLGGGALISTALLALGVVVHLAVPDAKLAALLMRAGLVVLMATPVLRVVASVVEYAVERDWLFLGMTASVLAILLGSLITALK